MRAAHLPALLLALAALVSVWGTAAAGLGARRPRGDDVAERDRDADAVADAAGGLSAAEAVGIERRQLGSRRSTTRRRKTTTKRRRTTTRRRSSTRKRKTTTRRRRTTTRRRSSARRSSSSTLAAPTSSTVSVTPTTSATSTPTCPPGFRRGKSFDRLLQIWLENEDDVDVSLDPDFAHLASLGIKLSDYHGLAHPSHPNYVGSVAGFLAVHDSTPVNLTLPNIADLLDAGGVPWGVFAEGFPGNCSLAGTSGRYARRHNPLIEFTSIHGNASRCARIEQAPALDARIAAGTVPQWAMYVPDLDNDGHDTSISFAGKWVRGFLEAREAWLNSTNTLVLLVFDEGRISPNNHVFALLLGPLIPPALRGTSDAARYDHYSIMSTAENNWDLGNLGRNDTGAPVFGTGLVRRFDACA
ncbi:hypothetical protein DFJ74DRAFT_695661 [Hyaloraphidium curvatum]|nr:hypothetical protein DFJ74DRAFT_695661 [Hyaloraphidium curvatum]